MNRPLLVLALWAALAACSSTTKGGGTGGAGGAGGSGPDLLLNVPSPNWRDQVIYFVFTDRFADGDTTNDDLGAGEYEPADENHYSGGDLQGIIDHLDYIQGLGASAIWITPPVANMWWDPLQQSGGYHGYWARNLKKVDEHEGTLDTYRKLSDALHRRGMYLIQDIVPNHMGNFFTYDPALYDPQDPTRGFIRNLQAKPGSKPEDAPFDENDATDPTQRAAAIYHWTPPISDYNDMNQQLNYQISDLDDLDSENPVVRTALRDAYGYWIKEVGVDGFRVDTAKFVPHDFWNDFFQSTDPAAPGMAAVARATGRDDLLAFGEVFNTSDPYDDAGEKVLSSYLGTTARPELPSVLQFPLYQEIAEVIAGGKPTRQMTYRLTRFMDTTLFPDPHRIPTFIDNHDVNRFLSGATSGGFNQALIFLLTTPGIPVILYGTEQLFTVTRQSMFAAGYGSGGMDHFSTQAPYYVKVQQLVNLRRSDPVFSRGSLEVLYDVAAGPGPFAYARRLEGKSAVVILNTAEEPALLAHMPTGLPGGSVLAALHKEQGADLPVVARDGTITEVLPPRGALVLEATGDTQDPGAPPAVITVDTTLEGQTFTGDVTITGKVEPKVKTLQLVLDSLVGKASAVTLADDGTFSVVLPVSLFPEGKQDHALEFWSPDAKVASDTFHFTTDVMFSGQQVAVDNPAGDDDGPAGTYAYPMESTFNHQQDITRMVVKAGKTTLTLNLTMKNWSTIWGPTYGFDHVCFNVFFDVPGKDGLSTMPRIHGTAPDGFAWDYMHFATGWDNLAYSSAGADGSSWGTSISAPTLVAQGSAQTLSIAYDRNALGLDSWEGTKIWVTTWDYDGIQHIYRHLTPAGGQWDYGGGMDTEPYIMDSVGPVTVPAIP